MRAQFDEATAMVHRAKSEARERRNEFTAAERAVAAASRAFEDLAADD
jgi:hypothetical protein